MNPAPVDLNKLKSILSKSKAIMNTVESDNYKTGNIDASSLVQEGLVEHLPDGQAPKSSFNASRAQQQITENMIDNSRLPEAIKQAMKNNPIPQPSGPTHTFTLDDVSDMIDKPIPPPQVKQRQVVKENVYQPTNLDEERMRTIVKEEMTKFFSGYFMKQITETIQKQTIKNLLDSGIIKRKTTISK